MQSKKCKAANCKQTPLSLKPKQLSKGLISGNRFYIDLSNSRAYLTRKEAACVLKALDFDSYKHIAENLNISARTVEFYFSKIKSKFNYQTKVDLILEILKLQKNGLIDMSKLRSFAEN